MVRYQQQDKTVWHCRPANYPGKILNQRKIELPALCCIGLLPETSIDQSSPPLQGIQTDWQSAVVSITFPQTPDKTQEEVS
jgi:hypothetical protein